MIRIVRGIYGMYENGVVIPKTAESGEFTLPDDEEARLVSAGVAEYCGIPVNEEREKKSGRSRRTGKMAADESDMLPEMDAADPV